MMTINTHIMIAYNFKDSPNALMGPQFITGALRRYIVSKLINWHPNSNDYKKVNTKYQSISH